MQPFVGLLARTVALTRVLGDTPVAVTTASVCYLVYVLHASLICTADLDNNSGCCCHDRGISRLCQ